MGQANVEECTSTTSFFEGVEKLLEVWFTRSDGKLNSYDLRKIPRVTRNNVSDVYTLQGQTCSKNNISCLGWKVKEQGFNGRTLPSRAAGILARERQKIEGLLRLVKCEVISFTSNDYLDAYVLSESSLFVSKRRVILKTCGTTTPLKCLQPLFILVKKYAGFDQIEDVFYSRKNYKRPDLQIIPHRNFDEEVNLMDTFFTDLDGAAYCLGSINRDCWYLYTLNPLGGNKNLTIGVQEPDQTLEILMTNLDTEVMRIFTKEVSKSGKEATVASGINCIIPNAVINEHLFEPCGYSMNGIFKNSENGANANGSYMTIHITPEPEFSYVSFETNVPQSSYKDIIVRVLDTFQPGQFVVTLFANKASVASPSHLEVEKMVAIKEWLRLDSQFCHFKNYDLTYALYTKFPS